MRNPVWVIVLAFVALGFYSVWWHRKDLPRCGADGAISDVKNVFGDAAPAKKLQITRLDSVEEIERSAEHVLCKATAKLNDGTSVPILYLFYFEKGELMIQAVPDQEP
jgi:hypothetical protein